MRKELGMGILVLLVLALAVPASAAVTSQSTSAIQVTVSAPDEVKPNGFNYVTITFKNTASYPVSARVVVIPSYFALQPEWFNGVNAMKTGSGVTFTLHDIPAGGEKVVKVVIPGDRLEGIKTESGQIQLFKKINVYPFAGSGAMSLGLEAKNLNTLSVEAPTSKAFENTSEVIITVVLIAMGFMFAVAGAKFLS